MSDQERAQEKARKKAAKAEKPQWALTDKLFEYYLAKVDNLERATRRMTDDELREYFSDNSGLTSKQIEIVITRLNNLWVHLEEAIPWIESSSVLNANLGDQNGQSADYQHGARNCIRYSKHARNFSESEKFINQHRR